LDYSRLEQLFNYVSFVLGIGISSGANIEDIANNCRLNEFAVRDTLF